MNCQFVFDELQISHVLTSLSTIIVDAPFSDLLATGLTNFPTYGRTFSAINAKLGGLCNAAKLWLNRFVLDMPLLLVWQDGLVHIAH